jgi:adenosine deaminase
MLEIARDYELDVPYREADKFRALVQVREGEPLTHQNFLSKFRTLRKFFLNEEAIRRFTRETIADAADENIRYMELRFTPYALVQISKQPLSAAMDWVIGAAEEAAKEYGILMRLIASFNRHEDLSIAEEVVELSIERMDRGVVAVDLAGSEATHPGEEFAGVFKKAREAGLHVTIHGGEWSGPESVALAINQLSAQRIGHGVRVMEDQNVVDLARDKGVTFEVCPTSNLQSGVVADIIDHPLPRMLEAGLDVTINTDDPSISQIDLSDEIELACESLAMGMDQVQAAIMSAGKAAFLPEAVKEELVQSLEEEFNEKNGEM